MQGVELEHEQRETINWDDLAPPCEECRHGNLPSELIAELRHFHPINCSNERRNWFLCRPCFIEVVKMAARPDAICSVCGGEHTYYEV